MYMDTHTYVCRSTYAHSNEEARGKGNKTQQDTQLVSRMPGQHSSQPPDSVTGLILTAALPKLFTALLAK